MAYFIRNAGKTQGPFDAATLKQLAAEGRLDRNAEVSRDRQAWTQAGDVSGLEFFNKKLATPTSIADVADNVVVGQGTLPPLSAAASPPPPTVPPPPSQSPHLAGPPSPSLSLWPCRDCTKLISTSAKVCPHCGRPSGVTAPPQPTVARPPNYFDLPTPFLVVAVLGIGAMGIGILMMLYFVFEFDTAPYGTHNLGLLNDRSVGVALSATIALIGAVVGATAALGGILVKAIQRNS